MVAPQGGNRKAAIATMMAVMVVLSGLACAPRESKLDAAKRSALALLDQVDEPGFAYLRDHRDPEADIWLLEFGRGQERALVDVDMESGKAYGVDFSSAKREAYAKPLEGEPTLSNEAALARALAIARRFAPEADLRPDPISQRTAYRSTDTHHAPVCRIKLRVFVDGYEVEGPGGTVEFDRKTGQLISYVGGYDVSRRNATPAKPLTLQEAADCLTITLKRKSPMPLPDESRLALMRVDGRPYYALTWFLKYSKSKVSYYVDAGSGEVLSRTLYKG